jgi:hypothetical protein
MRAPEWVKILVGSTLIIAAGLAFAWIVHPKQPRGPATSCPAIAQADREDNPLRPSESDPAAETHDRTCDAANPLDRIVHMVEIDNIAVKNILNIAERNKFFLIPIAIIQIMIILVQVYSYKAQTRLSLKQTVLRREPARLEPSLTRKPDQRARISVDGLGVTRLFDHEHNTVVLMRLRNTGKLPARNLKWKIQASKEDNTMRNDFEVSENKITDIANVLSPDAEIRMYHHLDLGLLDTHGRDNRKILFVWGTVYYTDDARKSRWTRFCHRYERAFGRDDGGYDRVRQHQFGNGSDEDEARKAGAV